MKLPIALVAVRKVSSTSTEIFPSEEIEAVAQLILEVQGVINPLIVRRTGLDTFEVVEGEFTLQAARKAREINPLKGEVIQAIILDPQNEEAIMKQIRLLRR